MINLCDYGCGQEAKFYFKYVKKWCCSSNHAKCPKKRKERSERSKGFRNPMYGKSQSFESNLRRSASHKGRKNTKEHNKNISRGRNGIKFTGEHCKNMSISKSNQWKDPNFVRKQMAARNRTKPNKLELKVQDWLNINYPNEWKWVGGGEIIIGGKCPDFINGKKQIIELFGDYWHKGDDPEERKTFFKRYGYCTLVLWEKDLTNISYLVEKVNNFI